jgi:transposase
MGTVGTDGVRSYLTEHQAIDAALEHDLPEGLIESTNTIAFGFRSPEALIALALLALISHPPTPDAPDTHGSNRSLFSGRIQTDDYFASYRAEPVAPLPEMVECG